MKPMQHSGDDRHLPPAVSLGLRSLVLVLVCMTRSDTIGLQRRRRSPKLAELDDMARVGRPRCSQPPWRPLHRSMGRHRCTKTQRGVGSLRDKPARLLDLQIICAWTRNPTSLGLSPQGPVQLVSESCQRTRPSSPHPESTTVLPYALPYRL
ncbi:unnamed protein product [Arctogadus glacialis]